MNKTKTNKTIVKEFIALPLIFCTLLGITGILGIYYANISVEHFENLKERSFKPLLVLGDISSGLRNISEKAQSGRSYGDAVKAINGRFSHLLVIGENNQTSKILKNWRELRKNLSRQEDLDIEDIKSKVKNLLKQVLIMKVMINENINLLLSEAEERSNKSVLYSLLILGFGFLLGILSSIRIIKKIYGLYNDIEKGSDAMTRLLNNLDSGFMVFSEDGIIQDECTSITADFFKEDPKGLKFHEVLRCDKKASEFMEDWYQMAFSDEFDFNDIYPLAPQSFEKYDRYIALEYRPIRDEFDKVERIICIASDETEVRKLREEAIKESAMVQMVMLITKDKGAFIEFVDQTKILIADIKEELNKNVDQLDIEKLFRDIHSIKGTSASYHVTDINSLAHEFENNLSNIRTEQEEGIEISIVKLQEDIKIIENRFNKFLDDNKMIIGDLSEIENQTISLKVSKIEKISNYIRSSIGSGSELYRNYVNELLLEKMSPLFLRFENIVKEIANTRNKRVNFVIAESSVKIYRRPYQKLITSLIHAFRNAVDHGIEYPHERLEKGKKEEGIIRITIKEINYKNADARVRISIEDDGRGVSAQKLLESAIAKGFVSKEESRNLNEKNILQLLFKANFSLSRELSSLSGRGVGMDAIMYEARKLGGTAWFESVLNVGSKLSIEVPLYTSPIFRVTGSKRYYHNTSELPPIPSLRINEGDRVSINDEDVMPPPVPR